MESVNEPNAFGMIFISQFFDELINVALNIFLEIELSGQFLNFVDTDDGPDAIFVDDDVDGDDNVVDIISLCRKFSNLRTTLASSK